MKSENEVISLLPAAMAAAAAEMAAEDREVLAYFLARSAADTCQHGRHVRGGHRPHFRCGCFDCYISYWVRWDTSPDRVLIDRAVEAFEESIARVEPRRPRRRGKVRPVKPVPITEPAAPPPADVAGSELKPRAWADVTDFLNSRFWNLWSPGV